MPMTESATRWLIAGCSGAGKSTLARAVGHILGLPVIHLDHHFWNAGWVETPRADWEEKNQQLIASDRWVIDGNYAGSLDIRLRRAQHLVLIDTPPWRCLTRVLRRYRRHRVEGRPDVPDDCPERLPDLEFISYILSYRRRSRPRVLRKVAAHPNVDLTVLRSDAEIQSFLARLRRDAGANGGQEQGPPLIRDERFS